MSEQGHKQHFNKETAIILGENIKNVYPLFDVELYGDQVEQAVPGLELKDRVMRMTELMRDQLPPHYEEAIDILVASLGPELETEDGMFTEGWYLMPVARFVEEFGTPYFELSMSALNAITRRHTAEYAVRPFIERYPDQSYDVLKDWTQSESFHVRRLVSEGTRPRLPWASRLQMYIDNPKPVINLLTHLRDDPSNYVQKSVANNLNDIIKDHKELVIDILEDWSENNSTPERQWIIKHASRRLIKAGEPRIMSLLGFSDLDDIEIVSISLKPQALKIGESAHIYMELCNASNDTTKNRVDYGLHYILKRGNRGEKVYKISSFDLAPQETKFIEKEIKFTSTKSRKYYSGTHTIDVRLNGEVLESFDIELSD
jgi:3-methyladenine DNA glycosylase AlkC